MPNWASQCQFRTHLFFHAETRLHSMTDVSGELTGMGSQDLPT